MKIDLKQQLESKPSYTISEACDFLRISPVTLWRLRIAGLINYRRVASKIIFLKEDIEAYLERNKR